MALFSKYMQYYSKKNDYLVDEKVIRQALISTNMELKDGYKLPAITEFEQEMIFAYLHRIQSRMGELSDEEKKKLR